MLELRSRVCTVIVQGKPKVGIPLGPQPSIQRGKARRPGLPERFQAKSKPVRVKKTRQIKNLEPRFDSIEAEKALGTPGLVVTYAFLWLVRPINRRVL
jgi:hypothetical protein